MASRKEILEMLSQGQIDIERATELLAQTPASPAPEPPPAPGPVRPPAPPRPAASGKPRWLHIEVNELDSGRNRVRVNVPFGLMRFGIKIGARFTNELQRDVVDEVLQALDGEEMAGTLLEVEDVEDNERVHIYVD